MTFLTEPPTTPRIQALYDDDVESHGFVMDPNRAWAYQPDTHDALFDLLASESDLTLAVAVLSGTDEGLDDAERAMARWARKVTHDPNATTAADVQELRDAGLDDARIFAVTAFVALRLAFSTVNDAPGAVPDDELRASVPDEVRDVVTWGR